MYFNKGNKVKLVPEKCLRRKALFSDMNCCHSGMRGMMMFWQEGLPNVSFMEIKVMTRQNLECEEVT